MKIKTPLEDELRPEYDETLLKNGVRGKYVQRCKESTNLVLLDPDVLTYFPNAKAVNEALRMLIRITQTSPLITSRAT